MRLVMELIMALIVAAVLSGVFALASQRQPRRSGAVWVFLILFLGTWAGGLWMRPVGPVLWGIHWVTFLLAGVVVALFLAVFTRRRTPRGRHETLDMLERVEQEKKMEEATYVTLGLFFWALLVVLVIAILIRYLF